ncbi:MAG: hypothetical protein RL354_2300, partial [Planctomycetota bacterium]
MDEDASRRHASSRPGAVQRSAPRPSLGALLAVAITLAGSIAIVAWTAPLVARLWRVIPPEPPIVVEERRIASIELRVQVEESQGFDASHSVSSVLPADGAEGGDLRIAVTAAQLAFDFIREGAGWPPDRAGYLDGGLEFYRADLTVTFSDRSVAQTRVTRVAVTDAPGEYFAYAPVAGAGAASQPVRRVRATFDAGVEGVCELAR